MSLSSGRVIRTLRVDLPRFRTLAVLGEPGFGRLTAEIRARFAAQGATD